MEVKPQPIHVGINEFYGEYYNWGRPTGYMQWIPSGYYWREENIFIVASKMNTGGWTKNNKHSYKIS